MGQPTVTGTISQIRELSGFEWTLNTMTNMSSYVGGEIKVEYDDTSIEIQQALASNKIKTNELRIPAYIADDDAADNTSTNIDYSFINGIYADAYIYIEQAEMPPNGTTSTTTPINNSFEFQRNLNNVNNSKFKPQAQFWHSQSYWFISIGIAWQYKFLEDNDSDIEYTTFGSAFPANIDNLIFAKGGSQVHIFNEAIRDRIENISGIISHEMGHCFGLGHGAKWEYDEDNKIEYTNKIPEFPKMGIMHPHTSGTTFNLIDRHIHFIRSRVNSMGY